MSRKVQKVDTGEDNQESTEQRNCVDGIGSIEPLEEDERGAERGSSKRHVVQGVDTVQVKHVSIALCHRYRRCSIPPSIPTYMDVEN